MSFGTTDRPRATIGRRDIASAKWCSVTSMVHILCRSSARRRRHRLMYPCALPMLNSTLKV